MSLQEEHIRIVRDLSRMGSYGRAEGESKDSFPKSFYPVPEHVRAYDSDVVLIIGPRGAGKSELFRAVIELKLLPAIARNAPGIRLPPVDSPRTSWVAGYPIGIDFPDARGLTQFFRRRLNADEALELWFTYLIRALWNEIDPDGQKVLASIKNRPGGDAEANYQAFRLLGNTALLALDRLDSALTASDRMVFVGYDELDTLGGADWETMNRAVRGLVGFWSSYTRRWKRIRAKIFLRTDLYQRVGAAGGADLAKLAANRAEISWNDRNLYSMLVKRIANSSDALLEYCEKSKIRFHHDSVLGQIPEISKLEDVRPFIDRLAGQYMGAGVKKGLTSRWLLEHIRDGRGHALPRPLVRLIEASAEFQINSSVAPRWPRILSPMSLRHALDTVSEEHVKQSVNEWPWMNRLASSLRGEQVPWLRREIENVFEKSWNRLWGTAGSERPPAEEPRGFVDYLVEVGIFRARSDGRLDVADLFLAGLGLKRKGGVRQRLV